MCQKRASRVAKSCSTTEESSATLYIDYPLRPYRYQVLSGIDSRVGFVVPQELILFGPLSIGLSILFHVPSQME